MQSNGVPPGADHTSILVDMSGRIGRVEGVVTHIALGVHRIERRISVQGRPQRDWIHYFVGMAILGSAAAGKVTWQDALPSILGMFGR